MRTGILAAAFVLVLAGTEARAFLSSAIQEHQDVLDELRDTDSQIKCSLDITKALQAFNTGIYTWRTGVVGMMQAQAASANCMVMFPALYRDDEPATSQKAQQRGQSQEEPLKNTEQKLQDGEKKIDDEGSPIARKIHGEDATARGRIGGQGSPSGKRADQLISDLKKAVQSGLDANKKGSTGRQSVVDAAKAALEAAQKETQAAQKNREISNELNQLCSQIKALPKDPMSLPASIAQAMALASQGMAKHTTGMPPLTQSAAALAKAQKAFAKAKQDVKTFEQAIPGKGRPESADLPYVTKANDVRKKLEKELAETQKDKTGTGSSQPQRPGPAPEQPAPPDQGQGSDAATGEQLQSPAPPQP